MNPITDIAQWLTSLQDRLCSALEQADGGARFHEDAWTRSEGGGGALGKVEPLEFGDDVGYDLRGCTLTVGRFTPIEAGQIGIRAGQAGGHGGIIDRNLEAVGQFATRPITPPAGPHLNRDVVPIENLISRHRLNH